MGMWCAAPAVSAVRAREVHRARRAKRGSGGRRWRARVRARHAHRGYSTGAAGLDGDCLRRAADGGRAACRAGCATTAAPLRDTACAQRARGRQGRPCCGARRMAARAGRTHGGHAGTERHLTASVQTGIGMQQGVRGRTCSHKKACGSGTRWHDQPPAAARAGALLARGISNEEFLHPPIFWHFFSNRCTVN